MDILRARVVFRDRSLLDVLDLALRFVVVHGKVYATVAAAFLLPAFALTCAAAFLVGWAAAWCVGVVLAFSSSIAFTLLASRLVFQNAVKASAVIGSAFRDMPRVLFARFLWLIAFSVSAVFAGVPAVWTGTAYFFTDEVLLLERAGIGASFRRSQTIASTAFGDTFLFAFFLSLGVMGAIAACDFGGRSLMGNLLQIQPPKSMWTEGGSVLGLLGLFLVVPLATTARFFAYLNVLTRTEGWDVQIRFSEIASRMMAASGTSS